MFAQLAKVRKTRLRWGGLLAASVCIGLIVVSAPAHAYNSGDPSGQDPPLPCEACHGDFSEPSGPHGGYLTTTNKCQVCHSVHSAPADGILLLPAATITGTCRFCHDGTGGIGVYESIAARAGADAVKGEHSVDVTRTVPGGSTELTENLDCGSCHSPHGSNTVEPFLRDTGHAFASTEAVYSTCLLRDNLNGESVALYGAQWCAGCHDQRHSDYPSMPNHPVNADSNLGYDDVVHTQPATSNKWIQHVEAEFDLVNNQGLGRGNGAYTMPPVAETNDGRTLTAFAPLCQQCHEDFRDVESGFDANFNDYGLAAPYGVTNPAFVSFPHQTTSLYLLVEANDDLCTNCHDVTSLP